MARQASRKISKPQAGPHGQSPPSQATGPPRPPANYVAEWQGPLPPPSLLGHYDNIVPGSAERILAMAEREQKHRIAVEGDVVKSEGAATKRGQWLGGFVAIAAVVSAAGLAYLGAPWQIPVAFLSVPVLGIVSRLVEGRRSRTE